MAEPLSIQQIVAVIILFDLMRLVIPTFLSMAAYFFAFKKANAPKFG